MPIFWLISAVHWTLGRGIIFVALTSCWYLFSYTLLITGFGARVKCSPGSPLTLPDLVLSSHLKTLRYFEANDFTYCTSLRAHPWPLPHSLLSIWRPLGHSTSPLLSSLTVISNYGQAITPTHWSQFLTSETPFLLHLSLPLIVTPLDFVIVDNILLPKFLF